MSANLHSFLITLLCTFCTKTAYSYCGHWELCIFFFWGAKSLVNFFISATLKIFLDILKIFGELLGWKSSPDLATLVRTHSHSRIVNLQQLQIFSMPNIFPQIASLIIHTAWLSLAWTSTDLPPLSGICQRFIKTCRRVKNRTKIVQRELGIRQASNSKTPKDHTENKWLVGVQYELPLHLAPVMSSQCFQPNRLDSFDDEHPVSICLWWCDE